MLNIEEIRNSIIHGDALEVLKQLPDHSFDAVVTSPPYNMHDKNAGGGISTKTGTVSSSGRKPFSLALHSGYDGYADDMDIDEYNKWQRECLTEMMRVVKEDGAVFYNHRWFIRNGIQYDRQEIVHGFPLRQIIVWKKPSGIAFNEYTLLPIFEVIYIFARSGLKMKKGTNRYTDVWELNSATQRAANPQKLDHPAMFPVEIPRRCIEIADAKLVLDPFMGSGTTAVAAKRMGADYVGVEQSQKYIDMANERVKNTSRAGFF